MERLLTHRPDQNIDCPAWDIGFIYFSHTILDPLETSTSLGSFPCGLCIQLYPLIECIKSVFTLTMHVIRSTRVMPIALGGNLQQKWRIRFSFYNFEASLCSNICLPDNSNAYNFRQRDVINLYITILKCKGHYFLSNYHSSWLPEPGTKNLFWFQILWSQRLITCSAAFRAPVQKPIFNLSRIRKSAATSEKCTISISRYFSSGIFLSSISFMWTFETIDFGLLIDSIRRACAVRKKAISSTFGCAQKIYNVAEKIKQLKTIYNILLNICCDDFML